jgi:hypothetical protein
LVTSLGPFGPRDATFAWIGIDRRYSIRPAVADNDDKLEDMDEELARARKEAGEVDVYKYRRRFRLLKAILLGAALAGLTSLILAMVDAQKNPCERVRNYLCKQDPAGLQCKSYEGILDDSVNDKSAEMRSNIRAQCQTKLERLKEEGVEVK